jgi:hypothetical protein
MHSKVLCALAVALAFAGTTACHHCGSDETARGSVLIAWSITALGGATTCTRAGAQTVSVVLRSRRSAADEAFTFACTDSQATTPPVAAGPYEVTLSLLAADGATLAVAPTQAPIAIDAGEVTTLAPVIFRVEGGTLSLSFATIGTTTNCLARDQGGAGITASTITLEHAAGGCAPVTFVRSRGTTTLGTYSVICSSPQVATCIERDETLTIEVIESGPYVLRIDGLVGAVGCWEGADVVTVPAGARLTTPVQLARRQRAGC